MSCRYLRATDVVEGPLAQQAGAPTGLVGLVTVDGRREAAGGLQLQGGRDGCGEAEDLL